VPPDLTQANSPAEPQPVRRVVDLPIPERWVDLGGWLYTKIVYATQTVTHPSSNQAQCRATFLIETNVLTTTPRRHPCVDYNSSSTCDTHVDMQQNNYQNITINFLEIPLCCNLASTLLKLFWQKSGLNSQVKTEIHKNSNTQRNTSAHNYSTRMQLKIDTNIDRPSLSTSGWYFTNDVYGQEPPTC